MHIAIGVNAHPHVHTPNMHAPSKIVEIMRILAVHTSSRGLIFVHLWARSDRLRLSIVLAVYLGETFQPRKESP